MREITTEGGGVIQAIFVKKDTVKVALVTGFRTRSTDLVVLNGQQVVRFNPNVVRVVVGAKLDLRSMTSFMPYTTEGMLG